MKNLAQTHPKTAFAFLCGIAVMGAALLQQQATQALSLQTRIARESGRIYEVKRTQAEQIAEQVTAEKDKLLIAEYEKRIPFADASYIWVNRVLSTAAPKLSFQIGPPDFSGQQVPLASHYCSGKFQVQGSGSLDELLRILKKLETDLPFARIQDLHFSIDPLGQTKTDFTFVLMVIMKLDDNLES